jgi:hypothetical protein
MSTSPDSTAASNHNTSTSPSLVARAIALAKSLAQAKDTPTAAILDNGIALNEPAADGYHFPPTAARFAAWSRGQDPDSNPTPEPTPDPDREIELDPEELEFLEDPDEDDTGEIEPVKDDELIPDEPADSAALGAGIPEDLSPEQVTAQAVRLTPLDCLHSAVVELAVWKTAHAQLWREAHRQIAGLQHALAVQRQVDGCDRDALAWVEPKLMTSERLYKLIQEG